MRAIQKRKHFINLNVPLQSLCRCWCDDNKALYLLVGCEECGDGFCLLKMMNSTKLLNSYRVLKVWTDSCSYVPLFKVFFWIKKKTPHTCVRASVYRAHLEVNHLIGAATITTTTSLSTTYVIQIAFAIFTKQPISLPEKRGFNCVDFVYSVEFRIIEIHKKFNRFNWFTRSSLIKFIRKESMCSK